VRNPARSKDGLLDSWLNAQINKNQIWTLYILNANQDFQISSEWKINNMGDALDE